MFRGYENLEKEIETIKKRMSKDHIKNMSIYQL